MDLSVVIACTDARDTIDECLRRFERCCAGLKAELIVVDASGDGTAARVAGSTATLIRLDTGTLAPVLWAEGYRRSTGRLVAFTTGHCLPLETWATAMVRAINEGATGAGGPLAIGVGTCPLDWAVFYLRYSAFMSGTFGRGRIAGEIAGDNAAYRRDALDRHSESFAHGFWEVDFHQRVRAQAGWLAAVPDAQVEFGRSFPVRTIVAHRFAHGRYFGEGRARGGASPWMLALRAPAVPFVLAARSARRVLYGGERLTRFIAALPWFLVLAAAWAAGEVWGAWYGAPLSDSGGARAGTRVVHQHPDERH